MFCRSESTNQTVEKVEQCLIASLKLHFFWKDVSMFHIVTHVSGEICAETLKFDWSWIHLFVSSLINTQRGKNALSSRGLHLSNPVFTSANYHVLAFVGRTKEFLCVLSVTAPFICIYSSTFALWICRSRRGRQFRHPPANQLFYTYFFLLFHLLPNTKVQEQQCV